MPHDTPSASFASGCLMVGIPGPDLDAETAERLEELDPAGVILFRRNLGEPRQTRELVRHCVARGSRPALVAIDQEGGRVSRLAPWIGETPSAARLSAAGEEQVGAFAASTGRTLRALGINVDFAPVVDLSAPDATNGIADRAFGTDPDRVSSLAGTFLDALQGRGVAGCLKHFPGLGPTVVDSHVELPTVTLDRAAIESRDLRPFRALAARAATVMVSHAHYPAFEPAGPRPASCSSAIVDGLLRHGVGFRGVIVSDDLEMGAVAGRDVDGAAAVAALEAGCDLLLYCSDLERARRARRAITSASMAAPAFRARVRAAAERVRHLALEWPVPQAWDAAAWSACVSGFERFRGTV